MYKKIISFIVLLFLVGCNIETDFKNSDGFLDADIVVNSANNANELALARKIIDVYYPVDNCPGQYNPTQSDIDLNGIGDLCDLPSDPNAPGDTGTNLPPPPPPVLTGSSIYETFNDPDYDGKTDTKLSPAYLNNIILGQDNLIYIGQECDIANYLYADPAFCINNVPQGTGQIKSFNIGGLHQIVISGDAQGLALIEKYVETNPSFDSNVILVTGDSTEIFVETKNCPNGICTDEMNCQDKETSIVCGNDGKNYDNSCFASANQIEIKHIGICTPEECTMSEGCDNTQRLNFPLDEIQIDKGSTVDVYFDLTNVFNEDKAFSLMPDFYQMAQSISSNGDWNGESSSIICYDHFENYDNEPVNYIGREIQFEGLQSTSINSGETKQLKISLTTSYETKITTYACTFVIADPNEYGKAYAKHDFLVNVNPGDVDSNRLNFPYDNIEIRKGEQTYLDFELTNEYRDNLQFELMSDQYSMARNIDSDGRWNGGESAIICYNHFKNDGSLSVDEVSQDIVFEGLRSVAIDSLQTKQLRLSLEIMPEAESTTYTCTFIIKDKFYYETPYARKDFFVTVEPSINPQCAAQGDTYNPVDTNGAIPCCPGFNSLSIFAGDDCSGATTIKVCGACGDGQCLEGEDHCNCPEDCILVIPPIDIQPGNQGTVGNENLQCRPGLIALPNYRDDSCTTKSIFPFVCGTCDDGQCLAGETNCNCPNECDVSLPPIPQCPVGQICDEPIYQLAEQGDEGNADLKCRPGLIPLKNYIDSSCTTADTYPFVCGECGDGLCLKGESNCNCPLDCRLEEAPETCVEIGKNVSGPVNTIPGNECCLGLTEIKPIAATCTSGQECPVLVLPNVCLACGDGKCDQQYENYQNCDADCVNPEYPRTCPLPVACMGDYQTIVDTAGCEVKICEEQIDEGCPILPVPICDNGYSPSRTDLNNCPVDYVCLAGDKLPLDQNFGDLIIEDSQFLGTTNILPNNPGTDSAIIYNDNVEVIISNFANPVTGIEFNKFLTDTLANGYELSQQGNYALATSYDDVFAFWAHDDQIIAVGVFDYFDGNITEHAESLGEDLENLLSFYLNSFPPSELTETCTDSDGGLNFKTKGTATGCNGNNCSEIITVEDSCVNKNQEYAADGNILIEAYCDGTALILEREECNCQDGVCQDTSCELRDTISYDEVKMYTFNGGEYEIEADCFDDCNINEEIQFRIFRESGETTPVLRVGDSYITQEGMEITLKTIQPWPIKTPEGLETYTLIYEFCLTTPDAVKEDFYDMEYVGTYQTDSESVFGPSTMIESVYQAPWAEKIQAEVFILEDAITTQEFAEYAQREGFVESEVNGETIYIFQEPQNPSSDLSIAWHTDDGFVIIILDDTIFTDTSDDAIDELVRAYLEKYPVGIDKRAQCDIIDTLSYHEQKTYDLYGIEYQIAPDCLSTCYSHEMQFNIDGDFTPKMFISESFTTKAGIELTLLFIENGFSSPIAEVCIKNLNVIKEDFNEIKFIESEAIEYESAVGVPGTWYNTNYEAPWAHNIQAQVFSPYTGYLPVDEFLEEIYREGFTEDNINGHNVFMHQEDTGDTQNVYIVWHTGEKIIEIVVSIDETSNFDDDSLLDFIEAHLERFPSAVIFPEVDCKIRDTLEEGQERIYELESGVFEIKSECIGQCYSHEAQLSINGEPTPKLFKTQSFTSSSGLKVLIKTIEKSVNGVKITEFCLKEDYYVKILSPTGITTESTLLAIETNSPDVCYYDVYTSDWERHITGGPIFGEKIREAKIYIQDEQVLNEEKYILEVNCGPSVGREVQFEKKGLSDDISNMVGDLIHDLPFEYGQGVVIVHDEDEAVYSYQVQKNNLESSSYSSNWIPLYGRGANFEDFIIEIEYDMLEDIWTSGVKLGLKQFKDLFENNKIQVDISKYVSPEGLNTDENFYDAYCGTIKQIFTSEEMNDYNIDICNTWRVCQDPDGVDYFTKATTDFGDFTAFEDLCLTTDRLQEGSCVPDLGVHTYDCPVGCQDGRCLTPSEITRTYNLKAGWNLISMPMVSKDPKLTTLLAPIMNDVKKVFTYDSEWMVFNPDPAVPSNLNSIEPGKAYWVDMKVPTTLQLKGPLFESTLEKPVVIPSINMNHGWNLVGIHNIKPVKATEYFGEVKYDSLWQLANNELIKLDLNAQLIPDMGYWVHVTEEGVVTP